MQAVLILLFLSFACAEPIERQRGIHHISFVEVEKVEIVWRGEDGQQLRTFEEVACHCEGDFVLMNGGIFEPGEVPSGLLVQDAKELRPLNLGGGQGNFYLKPNGVFLIGQNGAKVVESSDYSQETGVSYAVQSGPLLLDRGKVHPSFNPVSKWRKLRNGVGVKEDGTIVLAISHPDYPVTFYEFAEFFLNEGCQSALYLDGVISAMAIGEEVKQVKRSYASIIIGTQSSDKE